MGVSGKKLKINLYLVTMKKMLWGGKGVWYLDGLVPQRGHVTSRDSSENLCRFLGRECSKVRLVV